MEQEVVLPYIISNVAAVALLICSVRFKKICSILLALLFGWASWTNWHLSHNNPEVYLQYSKYAMGFYTQIINGIFSRHITTFVSLIALSQCMIALGLLCNGVLFRIACIGAIIFLLAISPLGVGSAFPSGLTLSLALGILYKKSPKSAVAKFDGVIQHVKKP